MDLTPEKQAEKNTLTRQLKKNRNRKKIIILGSVALVAASAFIVTMTGIGIPKIKASDTTVLARTNIEKSISASGTVETSNAYKVYNTLNYPVEEIYVEVGQVVQKGDKLCQLDNDSLKKQIELKETAIGMSAEQAALLVKASEEKYNAAKAALANGTNSSIVSGNNAVNIAYYAWQKAKKGYDDYSAFLNSGDNSQILLQKAAADNAAGFLENARFVYNQAESDLSSAKRTLDQARNKMDDADDALDSANESVDSTSAAYLDAEKAYNDAKGVVDAAGASATQEQIDAVNEAKSNMDLAQLTLTNAKAAAAQAQLAYDTAKAEYDGARKSYDSYSDAEQQAKIALDNAQTTYDNANAQYQAAIKASNSTLADYELSV
ncbi:MAG: efflux RND transporter periplasmic adaptor subunit [Clostridiaceae bacterium]